MREVNGIKCSPHGCSWSQSCNSHLLSPSSALNPPCPQPGPLLLSVAYLAPTVIPDGSEAPFQVRISALVQSWLQ